MDINPIQKPSTAVFVDPKTDFGFKLLFGDKNRLIFFINSLIAEKIIDLDYLPLGLLGDTPDDRQAVYDLHCITDKGERIIVEMQRIFQKYFVDRMLFYAAHAIRNQAPKGKVKTKDKDGNEKEVPWNYELKKVYFIAVLDFTLFNEEEAKGIVIEHVDMMRRHAGLLFTDKLQQIIIELPKFTKSLEEVETEQDKWLYSLKNMGRMTERPTIMGKEFDDVYDSLKINKLNNKKMKHYLEVMRDERYLNLYVEGDREMEGPKFINKGIIIGEQRGEQRGIAIGEQKANMKQVQRMAARGMSVVEIADLTDLPIEEVKEILKNIRR